MKRTTLQAIAVAAAAMVLAVGCGRSDESSGGGGGGGDSTGVTDSTIKIGTSFPLSGPASAYATITKGIKAYFDYTNSKGGVNGRKIDFTVLDDGYEPPRAVTNAKRLVTQDKVFAVFNPLGTPNNLAMMDYLNQQKVPQVYVATGATQFGDDVEAHPWTIGWQPDYVTEAKAHGDYLKKKMPNATVAVLYQNDDFGKDFLDGLQEEIKGSGVKIVAKQSYEVTDPTVAPQVTKLASSKADVFLSVTTPKPAAQSIAAVAQSSWKPQIMISNVAASKALVFQPIGLKPAIGVLAPNYIKDPSSPQWNDDAAMTQFKTQLKKFSSGANPDEPFNAYGWSVAETLVQALKQAGKNLTRDSLMKAVRDMDFQPGLLLPGIKVKTGSGDGFPIQSVQVQRFDGTTWKDAAPVYNNESGT